MFKPNLNVAIILTICFDEETVPRGPGYWKFNNSLLSDNEYIALLRSKIPEFVEKYKEVEDKGLFWEMVKMEIRGLTFRFSKFKAKRTRDEEKLLTFRFAQLGLVVQKPINSNPRLKINQGVYFSSPKCCSMLIFGKTLHWRKSILKNKIKQKELSPKSGKHETKVYANPGLS